jgi:hypothetical protein
MTSPQKCHALMPFALTVILAVFAAVAIYAALNDEPEQFGPRFGTTGNTTQDAIRCVDAGYPYFVRQRNMVQCQAKRYSAAEVTDAEAWLRSRDATK